MVLLAVVVERNARLRAGGWNACGFCKAKEIYEEEEESVYEGEWNEGTAHG